MGWICDLNFKWDKICCCWKCVIFHFSLSSHYLFATSEVFFSSNRVCSDPFSYLEFSNIVLFGASRRCCSSIASRLHQACRHTTACIVSILTKCQLPIIPWIMTAKLPFHKFILLYPFNYLLCTATIYFTCLMQCFCLWMQILSTPQTRRRSLVHIFYQCRHTPFAQNPSLSFSYYLSDSAVSTTTLCMILNNIC
jgi:hypothetical protein